MQKIHVGGLLDSRNKKLNHKKASHQQTYLLRQGTNQGPTMETKILTNCATALYDPATQRNIRSLHM